MLSNLKLLRRITQGYLTRVTAIHRYPRVIDRIFLSGNPYELQGGVRGGHEGARLRRRVTRVTKGIQSVVVTAGWARGLPHASHDGDQRDAASHVAGGAGTQNCLMLGEYPRKMLSNLKLLRRITQGYLTRVTAIHRYPRVIDRIFLSGNPYELQGGVRGGHEGARLRRRVTRVTKGIQSVVVTAGCARGLPHASHDGDQRDAASHVAGGAGTQNCLMLGE